LRPKLRLRRSRAVQLITAVTLLAVPASAYALTSTTATAQSSDTQTSPLRLRTAPHHARFGDVVTIAGVAPASDAGNQVVLQTALTPGSAWHALGQAKVGSRGGFRFRVALRDSGVLRVIAPGGEQSLARGGTGSPVAAGGVSPSAVRPVTVAARFEVAPRQHAVLGGGSMHVAGKLLPAQAGRHVALQGHTSQGWRTLTTTHTGGKGGFSLRYAPGSGMNRHLRVRFAGDGVNARTTAPAGTVTVYHQDVASWYQDGGSTACGFHAGLGVANRTLPCGTKVQFSYGGRTVTAVVDDRGPYVGGRDWDLNQNTAAALGFAGVGTVWVAI